MMKSAVTMLLLAAAAVSVNGDMYMHNPRGSNDRNCERNDNRNNGNRLFDSQNNDKGGYACPRPVGPTPLPPTQTMYYYTGSKLQLEWTNQHGCGEQDVTYCQIILQYMCEDQNPAMRDGTPEDDNDAATDRMDANDIDDSRYGYHETIPYYTRCATRPRNNGLYTADQQVNQQSSIGTRQNPNGDRHGWECTEERDYYPYWHPAPWKDIAILSSDFGNYAPSCSWYKKASQNNAKYGDCFTADSETVLTADDAPVNVLDSEGVTPLPYNNIGDCQSNGGYWYTAKPLGGGDPDCQNVAATRPNSLGNDASAQMVNYVWTIPKVKIPETVDKEDRQYGVLCVLRIRYNISSADIPYDLDFTANNNNDADKLTGPNEDPSTQPFPAFNANDHAAKNIPYGTVPGRYNLTMAVNTDQYGRTFQDRSYTFYIRGHSSSGTLWNLNVRGKRGNIVQTFPAVEYDFVPQILNLVQGDKVHIQWTGSDYNPDTEPNNGEGGPPDLADANAHRADRSNLVQMSAARNNFPADWDAGGFGTKFFSKEQARLMAYLNQDPNDSTQCEDYATLLQNNDNDDDQAQLDVHNCYKLNGQATPYFDGGIVQANNVGTFHLMSSRNNNFSNRSQKIIINVGHSGLSSGAAAGVAVGSLVAGAGVAGVGGYHYAKRHPGSNVANFYNKAMSMPLISKVFGGAAEAK